MPVVTMPDGTDVAFPDDMAPDAIRLKIIQKFGDQIPQEVAKPAPSWGGAAMEAVTNIPSSAVKFGHDIIQPVIHPVDTAIALKNLGHGILQKFGMASGDENEKYADAVGKFLVDRYGNIDAVKKTLASDPVGMAGDLSIVLSGGGGLAARAPGIAGKVGEAVSAAGRAVDPLTVAGKGAELAGKGAAEVIGGLGTHTGGASLREAAAAGREGGETAKAFQENLRGNVPAAETVAEARGAVQQMRAERGDLYREGMAKVGADTAVLDFNRVDDALTKISGVKTYKGQNISPTTQTVRLEIGEAVRDWKALDPKEFHTAEGFDALKQKIGDIRDGTQRGTPGRLVADATYQAVRKTIIDQAPEYAKVMKGYEDASTQIKEIERTLSLNPSASIDTALRKLQSVLRDNVNTNYGQRAELAKVLVRSGAPHLLQAIAGQTLSAWVPRGLAKAVATHLMATGAGAAAAGLPGAAAATAVLPLMSPRLMGEAAYYGGKVSGLPGKRATAYSLRAAGQLPREPVLQ